MNKHKISCALAACAAVSLFALDRSSEHGSAVSLSGSVAQARAVGNWFNRAGKDIRRGFDKAGAWMRRAAHDVGRTVTRAVHDTGKFIRKTATNVGNWAKKAVVDTGRAFNNAGKAIGKWVSTAAKDAGTWIKKAADDVGKFVAKGFEFVKKAFCATIGMPICMVVDLIKTFAGFVKRLTDNKGNLGKTLASYWEDFKNNLRKAGESAKKALTGLFEKFRAFLTLKDESQFGKKALDFAGSVFNTVKDVTQTFTNLIGLPEFLGFALGAINGVTVTATLSPAVIGLAAINLGARKLFEWLLPELILGVGALTNAAGGGGAPKKPDGLLGMILNTLKQIAGPVAGGLIGVLVKDPKKKERIKAVLEKISNVAEKVEKGIAGVLSLSRKIASGKFEDVENALKAANTKDDVPKEFTPDQIGKMIDGLIDFASDEVWGLVNPKLRDVLGKGMSLLDKVFDIPRGIVVAGVGSIPFAGGVLSSALNFGLGLVVDIVKGFLIGEIMGLAEFILRDIMDGLKGAFKKRFFASAAPVPAPTPPVALLTERQKTLREAVRTNPNFRALVGSLGDSVEGVRESLRTASRSHRSTLGALAMTAMKDVVLRGVASAEVRELVAAALGTMAPSFAEPSFTLAKGIGAVLRQIEIPLGQVLGESIANPRIRQALLGSLAAIVRGAGSEREAAKLGRSRDGVLGSVGVALIENARPRLLGLLIGEHESPVLKSLVNLELEAMTRVVRREGFSSLLRFGELFRGAVRGAARSVAAHFVAEVKDPAARRALGGDMDVLAMQAVTKLLAERGAGGGLVTHLAEAANERAARLLARAYGGGK